MKFYVQDGRPIEMFKHVTEDLSGHMEILLINITGRDQIPPASDSLVHSVIGRMLLMEDKLDTMVSDPQIVM